MKYKRKNKILAILLTTTMILSLLPLDNLVVGAAEPEESDYIEIEDISSPGDASSIASITLYKGGSYSYKGYSSNLYSTKSGGKTDAYLLSGTTEDTEIIFTLDEVSPVTDQSLLKALYYSYAGDGYITEGLDVTYEAIGAVSKIDKVALSEMLLKSEYQNTYQSNEDVQALADAIKPLNNAPATFHGTLYKNEDVVMVSFSSDVTAAQKVTSESVTVETEDGGEEDESSADDSEDDPWETTEEFPVDDNTNEEITEETVATASDTEDIQIESFSELLENTISFIVAVMPLDAIMPLAGDSVRAVRAVYYGSNGRTNEYSLNDSTLVYCGDHNKNAAPYGGVSVTVSSSENSSLSDTKKNNMRKALYYSTVYSFSSTDAKIAMTTLALDYFKNGNSHSYANPFINYVNSQPAVCSIDSARMYCIGNNEALYENVVNTDGTHTRTMMDTYTSKNTPEGNKVKRTAVITANGSMNPRNSFTITVPDNTTMYVYRYYAGWSPGITDYDEKYGAGRNVTVYSGDRFVFTAPESAEGFVSIAAVNVSQKGYDAIQCVPSNSSYQTWYYLSSPVSYRVSFRLDWGENEEDAPDTAYLSLKKVSSNTSISNNNNCYTYEGAVYDVYHVTSKSDSAYGTTGTRVGRFVMNKNGTGIAQADYCKTNGGYNVGRTSSGGYLKGLPYGWYRIQEVTAPEGYVLNRQTIMVDLTSGGDDGIYSAVAEDEPVNDPAGIIIYKRDAETGAKAQGGGSLAGAEFTIKYYNDYYSKVSQLPSSPTRTWVLKTDSDGYCALDTEYLVSSKSSALYKDKAGTPVIPLGTITIEETKAPTGYSLDDMTFTSRKTGQVVSDSNGIYLAQITDNNSVGIISAGNTYEANDYFIRGDLKFTKTDKNGKALANVKFLITNEETGENHIVWTDKNGYYSTESSYVKHSKNTNGEEAGSGIWFGEDTVDDSKGALTYGTYTITELRCDANFEKYKTADPVTVTIKQNSVTIDLGKIINEDFPDIHTTARDAVTNNNTSSAVVEEVTLIDSVSLSGLDVGHTYTLSTVVMDKETGKQLVVTSGTVTAETTFKATAKSMVVETSVTFSSKGMEGKDVVFFESLTDTAYPDEIISRHEDINDLDQTIHFVDIHTTATGESGEKTIYTVKDVTIVDTVTYTGLTIGETYTVSGILMDKETGEPFITAEGNEVCAETTFIPETEDGSVEVNFTFNGVTLEETEVVVFEELYDDGYLLAVHADIEDEDQTVTLIPVRGDIRFAKVNEAGTPLADVMFAITNQETGERHIVWTDENGYYSTESSYILHSKNTNSGEPGDGIWFGEAEVDDTKGALPAGIYTIEELRCVANIETYKTVEPVEVTIVAHNEVISIDTMIDEKFPEIHTTAKDSVTNHHSSSSVIEEAILIDTVELSGLDIGHEYTLHTVVMDKSTGEMLEVESGEVTSENSFVADSEDMSIDVSVTFSTKGLEGKDVVFFETLTDTAYPDEIISRHEDINDLDQTIHFAYIHTTATGESGEKTIYTVKDVTIVDTVSYSGLTPGETYTVSGVLMDKETGEAYIAAGKEVTAEVTFIAEKESGSIEVIFTYPNLEVIEKQLVVFENLYYEDYLLTVHADLSDVDQTVTVYPIRGSLNIHKIDSRNPDKPVPGVTFELYKRASDSDTYIGSYTTDSNGEIYIDGLTLGEYYLIETSTNTAYILSEGVYEFVISPDDQNLEMVIENEGRIGSLIINTFSSEDEGGGYIPSTRPSTGDTFKLFPMLIFFAASIASAVLLLLKKKMNRRKGKKILALVPLLLLPGIITSVNTEAAEEKHYETQEDVYQTDDESQYDFSFDDEMIIDGVTYQLTDITYEKEAYYDQDQLKKISDEVTETALDVSEDYLPESNIEKDGYEYELFDYEISNEGETISLYRYKDTDYLLSMPVPDEKISYTYVATDATETEVMLPYSRTEELDSGYNNEVVFEGTVFDYDAAYIQIGSLLIESAETLNLSEAEISEILAGYGYNINYYRNFSAAFSGVAYTTDEGVVCRDFKISADGYGTRYRIWYEASFDDLEVVYNVIAFYRLSDSSKADIEEKLNTYKVTATAVYDAIEVDSDVVDEADDETGMSVVAKVALSFAIIIMLVLLVALIIYLIKGGRRATDYKSKRDIKKDYDNLTK